MHRTQMPIELHTKEKGDKSSKVNTTAYKQALPAGQLVCFQ